MNLINGGLVWKEDLLDVAFNSNEIEILKLFFQNEIGNVKINELDEEIIYDNLTISFKSVNLDELFLELCDFNVEVYELCLNGRYTEFYIRESLEDYSKTIVNKITEHIPSAKREVIFYGTYDEWNNEYTKLDIHFKFNNTKSK